MTPLHRDMYGFALAIVSALLFGASTPVSKLLVGALTPFQLAGLLYLGAAIGVIPVLALERQRVAPVRLDRASALRLAGAVFFGGVLGPVLLLFALRMTLAGSVSLLLNLETVATALVGTVLFRESLGRSGWLGVAGVVTAGGLLAGADGWPGAVGAALTAGACVCWGIDNNLTALIDGVTPAFSTLAKGAVAGLVNLAIGLSLAPLTATSLEIAAALAVGALSYGVSIVLYIMASHDLGPTRAQAVFASAPFLSAALAFGFLGESVGTLHLVAFALLVPAIAALFLSRHTHAHVHAAMEHVHSHRHDDGHHLHVHAGHSPSERHSHAHHHERLEHAHPHWPDLHHRHPH